MKTAAYGRPLPPFRRKVTRRCALSSRGAAQTPARSLVSLGGGAALLARARRQPIHLGRCPARLCRLLPCEQSTPQVIRIQAQGFADAIECENAAATLLVYPLLRFLEQDFAFAVARKHVFLITRDRGLYNR